ncbi:MAG TPA: YciI family protein [Gemmatimonadaceae bacterium]|nr:YciI family protein [Gemmatimonadaceae bacterium]
MKYVLIYEATPDFRAKVPAHIAAHRALWAAFHDDHRLLMVGPFTDEPAGGALGVFTTRAAAEEFVRLDPFVQHGIVARWTIREWNEVLAPSS